MTSVFFTPLVRSHLKTQDYNRGVWRCSETVLYRK